MHYYSYKMNEEKLFMYVCVLLLFAVIVKSQNVTCYGQGGCQGSSHMTTLQACCDHRIGQLGLTYTLPSNTTDCIDCPRSKFNKHAKYNNS